MSEPMSYPEIGPTRAATVEFSNCRTTVAGATKRKLRQFASPPLREATVAPTQTGCASGANGTDAEVAQTRDIAGQLRGWPAAGTTFRNDPRRSGARRRMNMTHLFPTILIAIYLGAGTVYGIYGDWWRVLYWAAA